MDSRIDWCSFIWALDYFSRSYLLGMLLITIWSAVIFVRVERRKWQQRTLLDSRMTTMVRNLDSLVGFSSILARALFETQIVQLCRSYFILRAADFDAVSAVDEARLFTQLVVCNLLALSAMRWRVCSIVADPVAVAHAANSLK
jgi:hypothetical protein